MDRKRGIGFNSKFIEKDEFRYGKTIYKAAFDESSRYDMHTVAWLAQETKYNTNFNFVIEPLGYITPNSSRISVKRISSLFGFSMRTKNFFRNYRSFKTSVDKSFIIAETTRGGYYKRFNIHTCIKMIGIKMSD